MQDGAVKDDESIKHSDVLVEDPEKIEKHAKEPEELERKRLETEKIFRQNTETGPKFEKSDIELFVVAVHEAVIILPKKSWIYLIKLPEARQFLIKLPEE